MNYEEYNQNRVHNAITGSNEYRKAVSKELDSRIKNKKDELRSYKVANKVKKVVSKLDKFKLRNKNILRSQNRVTVDVSQPVYTDDRSRFFKKTWEEEKKQLYFNA